MPVIEMPQISGPFTLDVTARFDGLGYGRGQTVFEFSDTAGRDAILFGQTGTSATVEFVVFVDGVRHAVSAENAIIPGQTAQWSVAVGAGGLMSITKNGVLLAQGPGDVPLDVSRPIGLFGDSHAPDGDQLVGVVSALVYRGEDLLAGPPVAGTAGNDDLTGTAGADVMSGLAGDDSLSGLDGDDLLEGGAGNDTLRGGYGDDTLRGGAGNDEIEGLYGNDEIDAGAGADHVFARDGDDLVFGGDGNDTLIGGLGTDTIWGGAGNDLLAGSQGNDEIHGGAGNDLAFIGISEDSDSIYMDGGNDFIDGASAGSAFYAEGGAGNDLMNAGEGDDTLYGNDGNDRLNGGNGNDYLNGGAGNDQLTGGAGDDVFAVQAVAGSVRIMDFGADGAEDRIDVSGLADLFDDPQALMAALSYDDGEARLSFDLDGEMSTLSIMTDGDLDEDDFIF
jgi:Ca2+-binding RTX toxin-like protein